MKTEQIKLRLKLVREFCKYSFSYRFTKAGFIYSPCKAVCELVFETMLIMKSHGLTAREIADKLDSYLITNILSDHGWSEDDVLILLAAPDLQAHLVWENYIEEKVNG